VLLERCKSQCARAFGDIVGCLEDFAHGQQGFVVIHGDDFVGIGHDLSQRLGIRCFAGNAFRDLGGARLLDWMTLLKGQGVGWRVFGHHADDFCFQTEGLAGGDNAAEA
jgi:hypothetical protein